MSPQLAGPLEQEKSKQVTRNHNRRPGKSKKPFCDSKMESQGSFIRETSDPTLLVRDASHSQVKNHNYEADRLRRKPRKGRIQDLDVLFCPICVEKFDEVELRCYPCPCGYRVCAMCIHLIKEKADGKCPSCRSEYCADLLRISDRIEKNVRLAMKEANLKEKKETDAARKKTLSAQRKRNNKPRLNNGHKSEPCEKAKDGSVSRASVPLPPSPPPPVVKLSRFTGGLSVWD